MSALRSVLDRLNDIEATISKVGRDSGARPSFGLQLSLRSLESRRDLLKDELAEVSQREFIDVCDYKIVPSSADSYAMTAVTSAWQDFQEMLSLVFGSIEAGQPRTSAKLSRDLVQKTQLNFGYAYQGSLGVVMTIHNDRLLLSQTTLDQAVSAVFEVLQAKTPERIRDVRQGFGIPVVRKLHHISKIHSNYGITADIKWVRDKEIRASVLAQPQEFAEICRLIEDKSDVTSDPVELTGNLVAWNTNTRTFMLEFPEGEPISGHWAPEFEGIQRTVPARYRAALTKNTVVRYAEERDQVTWTLNSLSDDG